MLQARHAVVVAVVLASLPAQARLGTRSLLEPRSSGQLGAVALTDRGYARGWLLVQAERYDVIKTKDGRVHIGKILRETAKGYLFAEGDGSTAVIEFEQVASISNTGEAAPPPPQPMGVVPHLSSASPVDTAHVYELQRERAELEADSPSIGGPIVAMCIGVPLILGGYVLGFGISASGGTLIALMVLGVTGMVVGSVLVVVGGIKLMVNIIRRATRTARMNTIDDELELLRRVEAPRPAPSFAAGPSPQWVVAVF